MRRAMFSLLLLAGCVTAGSTPENNLSEAEDEAQNVFLLRRSGGSDSARFDEKGAQGLNFQLGVYENNTVRGTAFGEPVELVWTDTTVKGTAGALPVDLHLETQGGALRLVGLYQGNQGDLLLDAKQVNGQLGRCHYEMGTIGPSTYKGQRSCQDSIGTATVRLPKRLVQMPLGQFAAFTAVMLSH